MDLVPGADPGRVPGAAAGLGGRSGGRSVPCTEGRAGGTTVLHVQVQLVRVSF